MLMVGEFGKELGYLIEYSYPFKWLIIKRMGDLRDPGYHNVPLYMMHWG